MARPAGTAHTPGLRPTATKEVTVDKQQSTAHPAHPSSEDHDRQDERPHACNNGWVTIGQMVIDPETGEETEEFAMYLCRRCADAKRS